MTLIPQTWNALSPLWKSIVAIAGGLTTISAVWKLGANINEWATKGYDAPVLELLRGRENVARRISSMTIAEATPLSLMVTTLRRKGERINKSLLRLERQNQVHREGIGWQFGPIPPRKTADLERWK